MSREIGFTSLVSSSAFSLIKFRVFFLTICGFRLFVFARAVVVVDGWPLAAVPTAAAVAVVGPPAADDAEDDEAAVAAAGISGGGGGGGNFRSSASIVSAERFFDNFFPLPSPSVCFLQQRGERN